MTIHREIGDRHIQAGQAWAAANAEQGDHVPRLCSNYSGVGAYVLNLRQHPCEQIRWCEAALTAARRLKIVMLKVPT